MNISYSELILLNNSVLENVDHLIHLGADRVELMMDGAAWDSYGADFSQLVKELRKRNVSYSVHPAAWDINLTAETCMLRAAAYEHHLLALRFSAEIGANQIVLHPGFLGSPAFSRELAKLRAKETMHRLAEVAKSLGVQLAMENVGYRGQSIYTEEEFVSVLDDVDPIVGYLVDVGHAHINGWNIPILIEKVAPRLLALHIHDNDGKGDQHLPIYQGTMEWESIFQAMTHCNADCEFILEYAPGTPLEQLLKGREILLEQVRPFPLAK
jgi:sugar phosphate isomerase/epimerase